MLNEAALHRGKEKELCAGELFSLSASLACCSSGVQSWADLQYLCFLSFKTVSST